MRLGRVSARLGAAGLGAIAGLHCIWATGSSWPLADHAELGDKVAGRPPGAEPSAAACLSVAALLVSAAALVDGHPRSRPVVAQVGAAGVAAVLALRGGLGIAGRTDLLAPGSTSEAFRSRDRRVYSPICLTLAALSIPTAVGAFPGQDQR